MSQEQFRRRLSVLIDEFLSRGGDPWWLNRELSQAGMEAIDSLRCDLVECDEEGGAA
jgi:hypothetical protein